MECGWDGGIGFDRASYRSAEDTGVTGEPVDVRRRIDVAVDLGQLVPSHR